MHDSTFGKDLKRGFHDPHDSLGLHKGEFGAFIRVWRPGASDVHIELFGEIVSAEMIDPSGVFQYRVPEETAFADYRVYHQSGLLAHDPYAFASTFGEMDCYLFNQGTHYLIYEVLGAHPTEHQGVEGVKFAIWAPHAFQVSLIADFNFWDGRVNPMRRVGNSGVWELFVPGLGTGEKYKFEIHTGDGHRLVKSDPYGNFFQLRPDTASIAFDLDPFLWTDQNWMEKRKAQKNGPMLIYEVHLGSWRQKSGNFLNYRELAHQLSDYCKKMHFTHIELMPVEEHPLDESWGYQVTGFYAPTSRYGTPEDFQYFVNHMHEEGIGVILDWVPAHFPTDEFSLAQFDGAYLYEYADPKQGFHPHWNTHIFNYAKKEVTNFLIGSALFWLQKMHIDGLRVDAVASMLYLDYGREEGEWVPNKEGGNINLEAIEFIKHLNSVVHDRAPGTLMFAEESTAFKGVTHPLDEGGLGFDFKWNMGWMNDTLSYFEKDPLYRYYHQNMLTFSMMYAYSENFALVLSHDEVVHLKKSLLSKMPGDRWQQFANLRLLLTTMLCHPGKKLLFMGSEFGMWDEWDCKKELPWHLTEHDDHRGLWHSVRDMNRLYQEREALWRYDFEPRGFEWVDFADNTNSVISFLRKGEKSALFCVHHFTPSAISQYQIPLSHVKRIKEIFNTDATEYGGSGVTNPHVEIVEDYAIRITMPPLATAIFEVEFEEK